MLSEPRHTLWGRQDSFLLDDTDCKFVSKSLIFTEIKEKYEELKKLNGKIMLDIL